MRYTEGDHSMDGPWTGLNLLTRFTASARDQRGQHSRRCRIETLARSLRENGPIERANKVASFRYVTHDARQPKEKKGAECDSETTGQ